MNLQQLIESIVVPADLAPVITQMKNEILSNPKKYDYMVDDPHTLNEDFTPAYRKVAERYAKGAAFIESFSKSPSVMQNMQLIFENSTFYLHGNGFLSTIKMLATPEQADKWLTLGFANRIIGGYAQTEIGHGSNVQGLETTAIYDKNKDEFVINSPSSSAYKYWPGMIGIFGTHCVAQCQTFVKGKNIGIQTFILPLRDPKTYQLVDSVDAGDIGPKLGFLRADNGFAGFNNLRVPRENLLMKYTQVDKDGNVTVASKDAIKFGYGSMLYLRVNLVNVFSMSAMFGNVKAYNQLKNRFETIKNTQTEADSFKLIKNFSFGYAFLVANRAVSQLFELYNKQLEQKLPAVSETLQMVHQFSSQFKSISGWEAIRSCREAVQIAPFGHLNASGIVTGYADDVPFSTYEGDNNVLLQQTAQHLLKQFTKLSQSKKCNGICEYFNNLSNPKSKNDYQSILENLTFELTKYTLTQFQQSLSDNQLKKSWNELHQVDLINMARIFGYVNVYRQFVSQLNELIPSLNKQSVSVLDRVGKLFALFVILENRALIVSFNIQCMGQVEVLDTINEIMGNRNQFLEQLSEGIQQIRLRNVLDVKWDQLNIAKL